MGGVAPPRSSFDSIGALDILLGVVVASTVGAVDTSTLWRAFTQRLGVTPAAYRERFASQ